MEKYYFGMLVGFTFVVMLFILFRAIIEIRKNNQTMSKIKNPLLKTHKNFYRYQDDNERRHNEIWISSVVIVFLIGLFIMMFFV